MARPIYILAILGLLVGISVPVCAQGGRCNNHQDACADPCPALDGCSSHEECGEGRVCDQACVPAWCACDPDTSTWACSDHCAGRCVDWFGPTGPLSYVITDIGTLGGWTAHANAINDSGEIVGEADIADGTRHAFRWDGGVMTDLHKFSSEVWSIATDINASGEVLIHHRGLSYVWTEETLQRIMPEAPYVFAAALNDTGQIVGSSSSGFFLWHDGVMVNTGEEFGVYGPVDINNSGHIAGAISVGSESHAGIWNGSGLVDLGTLGGSRSSAAAINGIGQVVGGSDLKPDVIDPWFYSVFIWESGSMTDIGALAPLPFNYVNAVNNSGQVVGESARAGMRFGFLYDSVNGYRNLRDLLPLDNPWWYWYQLRPLGINAEGQIVGYGAFFGSWRAFLMTPIDTDYDEDGDSDLEDYASFVSCLSGPGTARAAGCRTEDTNRNGSVDLKDFRAIQWKFAP